MLVEQVRLTQLQSASGSKVSGAAAVPHNVRVSSQKHGGRAAGLAARA